MACFHECRNIPDDRVTYPAKSTVYIIFFHRNATSVLLPPSEPEVITFPSRTQTSIFIKILLLIVVCSSFLTLPPPQLPAPATSLLVCTNTLTFLKASRIFLCYAFCYMCFVLCIHVFITCLYFSLHIGHYIILHHVLYFICTIVRLSHSLLKAT